MKLAALFYTSIFLAGMASAQADTLATLAVFQQNQPVQEKASRQDTLPMSDFYELPLAKSVSQRCSFDETLLNFEKWRREAAWLPPTSPDRQIAQISVLPKFGTNPNSDETVTTAVSMNLLWGVNGEVSGLEIGGGLNTVKRDMTGFQAAIIGNHVKRNVTGTQVGGLFNHNGGATKGLQAAGLFNLSHRAEAAQTAGLVNWVREDVSGVQASGLFNRSGGSAKALQASGLFNAAGGNAAVQTAGAFNLSRGNAKLQVSGLFNIAKDVEIGQFGGLVNLAKGEMKGFQIGFLNISDTVSGVPIGLVNVVKHGYNKIEVYSSEILHGNFQLKMGAHIFYNIFQAGARVPLGDGHYLWSVGYGIGTVIMPRPRNHLNFELMALHINEDEVWTNTLNSIGQFRLLWNYQFTEKMGFFAGPAFNLMASMLRNPETGEIRSTVVPYALIDRDLSPKLNLKGWIGVSVGFRFR